jgi:hypothetical protein
MMKLTPQWERRLGDDVALTVDQRAYGEWVPPGNPRVKKSW